MMPDLVRVIRQSVRPGGSRDPDGVHELRNRYGRAGLVVRAMGAPLVKTAARLQGPLVGKAVYHLLVDRGTDGARKTVVPLEGRPAPPGADDLLGQAVQLDQLVGARLRRAMDPLGDVESYLKSQKGGPNPAYKRPDV